MVSNSNFIENFAKEGGIIFSIDNYKAPIFFENCSFSKNSAISFLISALKSTIIMKNIKLTENKNNLFLLKYSVVYFYNSTIESHLCFEYERGCFISGVEDSFVDILNSTINKIISYFESGIIYTEECFVSIQNSEFSYLRVKNYKGSCVFSSNSIILISNSLYSNYDINCMFIEGGNMIISDTFFDNLYYTDFIHENNIYGTIFCSFSEMIVINKCFFNNSRNAQNGGAVTLISSNSIEKPHVISNCVFENNSAYDSGGAIYINNAKLIVIENLFFENSAKFGAAVYFDTNFKYLLLTTENCSFIQNNAYLEGGAIKWNSFIPDIGENNTFKNNKAKYGNNIAAFPIRMKVFLVSGENRTILNNFKINQNDIPLIQNVSSGNNFPFNITIEVVDYYDQIVTSLSYNK